MIDLPVSIKITVTIEEVGNGSEHKKYVTSPIRKDANLVAFYLNNISQQYRNELESEEEKKQS